MAVVVESDKIPKGKAPDFLFKTDWQIDRLVKILWILGPIALGIRFLQGWK